MNVSGRFWFLFTTGGPFLERMSLLGQIKDPSNPGLCFRQQPISCFWKEYMEAKGPFLPCTWYSKPYYLSIS